MGYTHYMPQSRHFTNSEWQGLTDDVRKVLVTTDVPLRHEYDEPHTQPEVSNDQIFFNGVDDDGHETFVLEREGDGFNFCKTARKPYDVVVTAILILAHHHAPGALNIGSDGYVSEWEDGLALAKKATERNDLVIPISD